MNLFVFFHVTPSRRSDHAKRVLSIIARRPSFAHKAVTGWAIENLSGSPLTHVTVADQHTALLSRVTGGDVFVPIIPFIESAPGLAWLFEIPSGPGFNLESLQDKSPKSVARGALRRASGGIVPARSCVNTAVRAIRSAGHRVPGRIVTAGHLFDWIRSQGHAPHDLSEAGEGDEERVGDAARRYVAASREDYENRMREAGLWPCS